MKWDSCDIQGQKCLQNMLKCLICAPLHPKYAIKIPYFVGIAGMLHVGGVVRMPAFRNGLVMLHLVISQRHLHRQDACWTFHLDGT